MKQHSNKTHCPACGEPWEYCLCDELYPEMLDDDFDDELFNQG